MKVIMKSSAVIHSQFSSFRDVSTRSGFIILLIIFLLPAESFASIDTLPQVTVDTVIELNNTYDTLPIDRIGTVIKANDTPIVDSATNYPITDTSFLSPAQKKKRIILVAGANVIGYGTAMVALYSAWYSQYEQTSFHTFNDFPEWKQMDKAGHIYSAYIESRVSMEMWRWTGIERKKRIWIGGMSGAFYQTAIEVLDGFSEGWGWSWGDFGANIIGSGSVIAQELAWDEQRVQFKFSFHRKNYSDPQLVQRSNSLFGKPAAEKMLKDYNGQTYWASVNLKSFFKRSSLPSWLSFAVGYGAEGLFGGTQNYATDETGNVVFNRPDIKRYRQWYISPDIDLSKIRTKSKMLKVLFTCLNVFKFPLPALEFSNGKVRGHAVFF